jgi:hypothetical protein
MSLETQVLGSTQYSLGYVEGREVGRSTALEATHGRRYSARACRNHHPEVV